jgi:RNA polymerase sigma-70 factor (ECF subfamily)
MLLVAAPADSPQRIDEAAEVARARAGDHVAFEALYRRHVARVYGAISRLVGGHAARAEELTQDAFVRAWQALPQFRGEAGFGTWLYRVALNTAMMDLRARSGGLDRETDDAPLQQAAATPHSVGTELDLARAVASLPPRARAVLVLFDIEGWTHEEIAGQLQMAVGSSKAQLHRARQLLRERLEGHRP